ACIVRSAVDDSLPLSLAGTRCNPRRFQLPPPQALPQFIGQRIVESLEREADCGGGGRSGEGPGWGGGFVGGGGGATFGSRRAGHRAPLPTRNATMLLPMLVAGFAAMLVPILLRDAPIYDSLREHTLRRERVLWQKTQKE